MSDDVLDQAAERLAQKFHAAYERLAPSFGYETREASARPWSDVPDPNRSLMIAVAGEVLSEAPVPAVDDHPTLATLLCDITGLGPETWPVVCDVTVIELADRLTAAGYVRPGPVPLLAAGVVRVAAAEQFVVEIDWCDPPRPKLVGPFSTRETAHGWGSEHIQNGEWCVGPLAAPDPSVRGTDSAGGERHG